MSADQGDVPEDLRPIMNIGPFVTRLHVIAMTLLIVVLGVHLMQVFATTLQQLLVAALLGYLIVPAYAWLVRRGLSPWLAGVTLLVAFFVVSSVLGWVIYNSFEDLYRRLPAYQKNLDDITRRLAVQFHLDPEPILEQIHSEDRLTISNSIQTLRSVLGSFLSFAEQLIVVVMYLVFLMAEQASFVRRVREGFQDEKAARIFGIMRRINESITQYLVVKTIVSAMTGVGTAIVLWLFKVDYAILWGVVAFLANYIPYIGSLVAVALPVGLCLLQTGEIGRTLLVLGLLEVIHNGIGFGIEPRMTGHRLDLSPLVILVVLALGATIWGTIGMILAIPVAVVIKIVLENVAETRPIAVLLSNG